MITREPRFYPPSNNVFEKFGRHIMRMFGSLGRGTLITLKAFLCFRFIFSRRNMHDVFYQMFVTGIKSLGVISVVALFTGMIFALQMGLELRNFGQEVNIGGAVTVVMLREMGPFMAAMILTASVGSSVGAQLGTMTVSEEIAALEIMSIDPIRYLVMPRLVAFVIMVPLLTFYTDILAILGGAIVGNSQLGVSLYAYFENALLYAETKGLYVGLFKSFLFGIIICTVACYKGFNCKGGAVGVGRATRDTVVVSFLLILIVGYIVTRLFYQ